MKGTVMFASLLVTGETLTCTGSDGPSASVTFCYSGSDLGETADGVGLESYSCLVKSFTKSGAGAGSHSGLERLRERRADQFPPVLFGPRRDPRHSGQVLRSRGGSARPLVVQLCRRDDVHWKRRPSQRRSFLLHGFEIRRD